VRAASAHLQTHPLDCTQVDDKEHYGRRPGHPMDLILTPNLRRAYSLTTIAAQLINLNAR
jgi:hypothetical protein